ncbi:tetratricopeptide repeat protein [Streptomyces sp. NPDC052101]|uniref:tetratricopeptide repeat protein n=1 Tax=Streptomyces sp. NPDC052101 TaxID=3155763 RepID=UPI00341FC3FE
MSGTGLHPALERADALYDLRRYDEAKAVLGQLLAEDPEEASAWVRLSRCHLLVEGETAQALETAERALAINPQHTGALIQHAKALQASSRLVDAEHPLREVIRLVPDYWYGYALLAHWLYRIRILRFGQANGGVVTEEALASFLRESDELALTAVRLAPEEVFPYEVRWAIARMSDDHALAAEMDQIILRLDPQHPQALARRTQQAAAAPGVKAAEAAALYADALAAAPDSAPLQQGLDDASYRLLRGVRWIALLSLCLAGTMLDLWTKDGVAPRDLPVPLGQRLWYFVPVGVLWAVGALLRYRRLRMGVRYNLRSLMHRRRWPRIVLGQASWAVLCALVISQVPWEERAVPRIVFWVGLVPTVATIWFDRKKTT